VLSVFLHFTEHLKRVYKELSMVCNLLLLLLLLLLLYVLFSPIITKLNRHKQPGLKICGIFLSPANIVLFFLFRGKCCTVAFNQLTVRSTDRRFRFYFFSS
jgi:hypothetical protein